MNIYINFSYWLTHFKKLMSIIIPKPNKPSYYDTPKAFHPIILLNTLGKLIEKAISSRLQIHTIASNFIHPSQLEGIKQCSTMDARIFLTYLIHMAWMKGLHTSTLAFDIIQFFPSLNHYLLPMILTKVGFDSNICYDQYLEDAIWSRAEGNNNMIGCAIAVSVSASYSRCSNLTFSLYMMTCLPYGLYSASPYS